MRFVAVTVFGSYLFSLTVPCPSALGTFCNALVTEVNVNTEMIPFRFDFRLTLRADIGSRHDVDMCNHKDDGDRYGNDIPRYIIGLRKPVDTAAC